MTPARFMLSQSFVIATMILLAACDDDGRGADNDNIWTGLSGLVIAIILGVILLRAFKKRS